MVSILVQPYNCTGLTIRELREILEGLPDCDEWGDPYTVWMEVRDGTSDPVTSVSALGKCEDGCDLLLQA